MKVNRGQSSVKSKLERIAFICDKRMYNPFYQFEVFFKIKSSQVFIYEQLQKPHRFEKSQAQL